MLSQNRTSRQQFPAPLESVPLAAVPGYFGAATGPAPVNSKSGTAVGCRTSISLRLGASVAGRTAANIGSGTPIAPGAAATTATSTAGRKFGIVRVHTSPFGSNGYGYSLQHATSSMARGIHAVIDGEIAANQVCTHGSILTSEELRLVCRVRLVFAIVDAGDAGVSSTGAVRFVGWLGPLATAAQTGQILHVIHGQLARPSRSCDVPYGNEDCGGTNRSTRYSSDGSEVLMPNARLT